MLVHSHCLYYEILIYFTISMQILDYCTYIGVQFGFSLLKGQACVHLTAVPVQTIVHFAEQMFLAGTHIPDGNISKDWMTSQEFL